MAITRLGGANAITGTIPTSVAPGKGKVLQVVQGSRSSQYNISTTTLTDLGLDASITPQSTSNKILVEVNMTLRRGTGVQNAAANVRLYKGGSLLSLMCSGYGFGQGSSEEFSGNLNFSYLDSPATISSTTYSVYGATTNTSNSIYFFIDNVFSSITLTEIEG